VLGWLAGWAGWADGCGAAAAVEADCPLFDRWQVYRRRCLLAETELHAAPVFSLRRWMLGLLGWRMCHVPLDGEGAR